MNPPVPSDIDEEIEYVVQGFHFLPNSLILPGQKVILVPADTPDYFEDPETGFLYATSPYDPDSEVWVWG